MDHGNSQNGRTPPDDPDGVPDTRRRIGLAGLALLVLFVVGLAGALAVPFLPAISWAVALTVVAWPMHRAIARRLSHPSVAAGLSTAIVAAVILSVGGFVTYQIASKAVNAAGEVVERADRGDAEGTADALREEASRVPYLGRALAWMERAGVDVEAAARRLIEPNLRAGRDLASGSMAGAVQFLLCLFILFFLFRDRAVFLDGTRALLPLSRRESDFLMRRAADSVHATLYGTLVTGAIDAVAFGLAFWGLGLPAPALWASIMFVLSVLPVLGAGLVWVPAMVYMGANGHWIGAGVIGLIGVVTAVYVDNALYARLAGGRLRMHDVPVMISFLGGLVLFGVSGMVLGPAILAVAEAALRVWRDRLDAIESAEAEAPPQVAVR